MNKRCRTGGRGRTQPSERDRPAHFAHSVVHTQAYTVHRALYTLHTCTVHTCTVHTYTVRTHVRCCAHVHRTHVRRARKRTHTGVHHVQRGGSRVDNGLVCGCVHLGGRRGFGDAVGEKIGAGVVSAEKVDPPPRPPLPPPEPAAAAAAAASAAAAGEGEVSFGSFGCDSR